MENCQELFLDDIVAVWPLTVGVLTHGVPETVVADTISVSDLGYNSLSALRSMLNAKVKLSEIEDGSLACMLSAAPTLKIVTDKGISGHSYTLTLAVSMLYYHETEKTVIRKMEWDGNDYIVETRDGSLCLMRYFAPAQRCTREKNDEGVNLTLTMRNVTGVQEIVPDESDE